MARLSKLLALAALLLTSFDMTAAPAAAAPASAARATHHGAVVVPMQHCPRPDEQGDTNNGIPECAMACSAALPAADLRPGEPHAIVCGPDVPWTAERLRGLHPETATPPPKDS